MDGISGGNSSIGAIHFGPSATTARTINNSSGVTAGNVTLNGITVNSVANTILRNNSATTHIITNGPQALGIVLGNATNNLINIDAAGGITIASVISGGSNALTKSGAGAGVLELTAQNTYTGATTVSGGTLRLNRTGGTTLPTGNSVTVNNGATLRISTAQTLASVTVDVGGTLILDAGLTVSGTFAVNGTLQINSGGFISTNAPTYGSGSTLVSIVTIL